MAEPWPTREESREILADYIEQHDVEGDGMVPDDPDPDDARASGARALIGEMTQTGRGS